MVSESVSQNSFGPNFYQSNCLVEVYPQVPLGILVSPQGASVNRRGPSRRNGRRWWQLKHGLFSPLPPWGNGIQFDGCIFFKWVVQPPTRNGRMNDSRDFRVDFNLFVVFLFQYL